MQNGAHHVPILSPLLRCSTDDSDTRNYCDPRPPPTTTTPHAYALNMPAYGNHGPLTQTPGTFPILTLTSIGTSRPPIRTFLRQPNNLPRPQRSPHPHGMSECPHRYNCTNPGETMPSDSSLSRITLTYQRLSDISASATSASGAQVSIATWPSRTTPSSARASNAYFPGATEELSSQRP